MRSGLLKQLVFPDSLTNQLVANLRDAINTLSGDDDVFTAPSTVLVGTGKIPAGAATVFYRGAPGAQLTLPSAQAQAVQGNARAALVVFGNEASGAVTLLASGADTINGGKSLAVAGGALQMVVSDGFNQWMVLAPAAILAWITSLTGDVVAAGPGAAASTIQPNVVTNAKAAQMAAGTVKGNNTGSTANALDLTVAQVTAMLTLATSSVQGLVPASGGGTTNFLRADLTWAAPPAPAGKTFLRRSILTSGTTLAKATGCTFAIAELVGGGGGGGGAAAGAAGQNAMGGGGESGAPALFSTSTIPSSWTYAIGAKGTGGANTGTGGTNGGDTTFSDGTTTVTAQGGRGGSGGTSSASPAAVSGGSGAAASNGTVNGSGTPGSPGFGLASGAGPIMRGAGGNSRWGGAGRGGGLISGTAPGASATAYGSGGAGAGSAASSGTGSAGGDGFQGLIILDEYA